MRGKNILMLLKKDIPYQINIKKKHDKEAATITSFILGNILYETNSYKNAINYFKESLSFYETNDSIPVELKIDLYTDKLEGFQIYESKNLQKIGSTYHLLTESDSINALKYLDSTKYYYERIRHLTSSNKEVLKIKAIVYNNITLIQLTENKLAAAESSVNNAIDI